ncbi:PQQ-binding-like beta-propeller repeat protein [Planctomycetota bacterium]
MLLSSLVLSLVLAVASQPAPVTENNWPQFRGNNCSGVACPTQNPPVRFGPDHNVRWKTVLPPGHSSPCIWGNAIFLTAYEPADKTLQVLCLDRTNGAVVWRRTVSAEKIEKVHQRNTPASSTPVTDGQQVYVYFGSCGLSCYDFAGELQWQVPMTTHPKMGNGHSTSPILVNGKVILSGHQDQIAHLLAFDAETGKKLWQQAQPEAPFKRITQSTPVLWNDQIVIHRGLEIVGHSLTDGTRQWWISAVTLGVSTPVIGNQRLYVGGWSLGGEPILRPALPDFPTLIQDYDANRDGLFDKGECPNDLYVLKREDADNARMANFSLKQAIGMMDANKDNFIDANEWNQSMAMREEYFQDHGLLAISAGAQGDASLTHVQWKQKQNVPEVTSPLYSNGRIYMVNNGGRVTCLNAKTGKLHYHREKLGATGPYYASPVLANHHIYAASGKGIVTVFKDQDSLEIVARNDLQEPIFATPAIVNHTLYIRTKGHLYAFSRP